MTLGMRRYSVILFWVTVFVARSPFWGVCGPCGRRYDSTYNTKPVKWFLKEGSNHSLIRKTETDLYKGLLLIICDAKRYLKVSSNIILLHVDIWFFQWLPSGSVVKNLLAIQKTQEEMRVGFPGSAKIPWRRTWQPTPVFLPKKSHRQSMGSQKSQTWLSNQTTTIWFFQHRMLRMVSFPHCVDLVQQNFKIKMAWEGVVGLSSVNFCCLNSQVVVFVTAALIK